MAGLSPACTSSRGAAQWLPACEDMPPSSSIVGSECAHREKRKLQRVELQALVDPCRVDAKQVRRLCMVLAHAERLEAMSSSLSMVFSCRHGSTASPQLPPNSPARFHDLAGPPLFVSRSLCRARRSKGRETVVDEPHPQTTGKEGRQLCSPHIVDRTERRVDAFSFFLGRLSRCQPFLASMLFVASMLFGPPAAEVGGAAATVRVRAADSKRRGERQERTSQSSAHRRR